MSSPKENSSPKGFVRECYQIHKEEITAILHKQFQKLEETLLKIMLLHPYNSNFKILENNSNKEILHQYFSWYKYS